MFHKNYGAAWKNKGVEFPFTSKSRFRTFDLAYRKYNIVNKYLKNDNLITYQKILEVL